MSLPRRKSNLVVFLTQEQYKQLLSLLNNANKTQIMANNVGDTSTMSNLSRKFLCLSTFFSNTPWILDSGATNHMVRSLNFLTSSTQVQGQTIHLLDESLAPMNHIGSINFSLYLILTNGCLFHHFILI